MQIRDFTPADYAALVTIQNALYPDHPAVIEDYTEMDENRRPECHNRKWVAVEEERVVGWAQYNQHHWQYDPHRFSILVRVLPDCHGHGIGTALYDTVIAALEPFAPKDLRTNVREDYPAALQFFEKRGYVEKHRGAMSRLKVADFDPAPYAALREKLADDGITLRSAHDLASTEGWAQKLYALEKGVNPDIPGTEDVTFPSFEEWYKDVFEAPMMPHDGYVVAVCGDEFVGMSNVWRDRASDMLYTGLTGVRRDYRRRGIATALKVQVIEWAKANGNTYIKTGNDSTNPMLELNYQLGYRPDPAWIDYRKQLRVE